jgi:hypothetical protein
MICLVLALQWGGFTYSWSAPKIIGLLITFAILLVIFVAIEVMMPEAAMAPTRVILNRSIAGSMTFMFLLSGALMSIIYYLTIWFQVVKGDSAIHSGVSTIPLLLSMAILSIPTAFFIQKIGYYVPALLLSPILCATGAGLLSTLMSSSGNSKWIGYQVLYGFGLGCGFQTSTLAPQTVLPRADVPLGIAMVFFMQQLGGAIFLSVSQNIFSNNLWGCGPRRRNYCQHRCDRSTQRCAGERARNCCRRIQLLTDPGLCCGCRPELLRDSGILGRGVEEYQGEEWL